MILDQQMTPGEQAAQRQSDLPLLTQQYPADLGNGLVNHAL
jgi:hypothetical protein